MLCPQKLLLASQDLPEKSGRFIISALSINMAAMSFRVVRVVVFSPPGAWPRYSTTLSCSLSASATFP